MSRNSLQRAKTAFLKDYNEGAMKYKTKEVTYTDGTGTQITGTGAWEGTGGAVMGATKDVDKGTINTPAGEERWEKETTKVQTLGKELNGYKYFDVKEVKSEQKWINDQITVNETKMREDTYLESVALCAKDGDDFLEQLAVDFGGKW